MVEKNKLFVGNLDGRVKRWHLKEFFAQYWNVEYSKVVIDEQWKSKKFGFVVFSSDEEASVAIEKAQGKIMTGKDKDWNEFVFGDREIRVMYAESKEKTE